MREEGGGIDRERDGRGREGGRRDSGRKEKENDVHAKLYNK